MTRPIRPASAIAEVRGARKSVESLAKRPAPVPGAASRIECIQCQSTTDLGTTYTSLDFPTGTNDNTWDSTGPTFKINTGGNLEIKKHGVYRLELWETNMSLAAGVTTRSIIRGRRIAGETPHILIGGNSFFAGAGMEANHIRRVIDTQAGGIINAIQLMVPDWSTIIGFRGTAFDVGTAGPCEIEFQAYHEENNAGVATALPIFHLACTRLGTLWEG